MNMKFDVLSLLAEMQDAMDEAIRASEHDELRQLKTCMGLITGRADDVLNLLSRSKNDDDAGDD